MSAIAIKAENLSKAYMTGQISHGTLIRDFESWLAKVRKKGDPYGKIDQIKNLSSNATIWALKNINFEIAKGETIAITGDNGAGKSTLLKILSRVTLPTTGKITVNGRITSLLEIGAGFHPELTGRENIFLYGAMLGMRKSQIKNHFDEITHFADIEGHLETPVKRYSSGMYMRLAFSVAAHLDSEILIIDEIMAVGDSSFQKKCLDKIKNLSKENGKTILLVSHNAKNIQSLCSREIGLVN
ncbi:MAG: ABC transporter ATP-binding protein, partial [Pedobacter sp.]